MYHRYLSTSCSTSSFRVISRECFKMSADIEKNERMVRFMPELKSPFAKYPLQAEAWLDIHTTLNNEHGLKTPAFIPHKADPDCPMPDIRDDYVWGAGPLSYGYYHILRRNAYAILISRIRKKGRPIQYCCFGLLKTTMWYQRSFIINLLQLDLMISKLQLMLSTKLVVL